MDENNMATAGQSADNGTADVTQQMDANGTQPTDPAQATTPPATPRTYTEQEYQGMSTSQYATGLTAAMRKAGYEPTRGLDPKAQLSAFETWLSGQLGKTQKPATEPKAQEVAPPAKGAETAPPPAQEAAPSSAETQSAVEGRVEVLERENAALRLGIPADKAAKYAHLAQTYGDKDTPYEKRLEMALKDFPLAPDASLLNAVRGAGQVTDTKPKYTPPRVI